MNIQIIGTKKCKDTQKAERFFKERRIPFYFRDLIEKGLTKGELDNITQRVAVEDLLNKKSKVYKDRGMMYMNFNLEEELLNQSLIIKTPIVRFNKNISVGYQPEQWSKWLAENR